MEEPWHLDGSLPPEVLPNSFIKFNIIRSIKFPELVYHFRIDLYMSSAFRFAQASRQEARFCFFQARESFGLVEVEVLVRDEPLNAQEVLDPPHLAGWVSDEPLAADEVDLGQREVAQPALQVQRVHAYADGVPGHIHQAQGAVAEGEALEGGDVRLLGERLRVIGDGAGHGVPHDHYQLGVSGHVEYPARGLLSDEIAGGLLQRDLALEGPGHQAPAGQKRTLSAGALLGAWRSLPSAQLPSEAPAPSPTGHFRLTCSHLMKNPL